MQTEFDYVIVGAGSAGCTVAARLTEDPDVSVLLIEAGGWDRDPMIGIPLAWGRNVIARRHDWIYDTEPAPSLNGRRIPVYRGRVIGGSSSINAMAYVRGHRGDYERWAASGLTDWSYAHVLPYFRRSESTPGAVARGHSPPVIRSFLILCSMQSSRPVSHMGCRAIRITTGVTRKALGAARQPYATVGAAARRWPICGLRSDAPDSRCRPIRS